jgi:hypothetical protein
MEYSDLKKALKNMSKNELVRQYLSLLGEFLRVQEVLKSVDEKKGDTTEESSK